MIKLFLGFSEPKQVKVHQSQSTPILLNQDQPDLLKAFIKPPFKEEISNTYSKNEQTLILAEKR